jgi:tRNA(fMet)-specific endonuclease VapC
MSGRYLLDSNVIIALFAGENSVLDGISKADEVPSIAVGELYYGAENSRRRETNLVRVEEFSEANVVLNCDRETARWYGLVKKGLKERGRPIPENDIWIAALALQHDLILVTRDEHFHEIASLDTESW